MNSFTAGAKYTGERHLRFSSEIAVYLENGTRYRPTCYGTLMVADRSVSVPNHMKWPWKAGREGQLFQADLYNALVPLIYRTTKFDRIIHVVRGAYSSHAPTLRRRCPCSALQFLGFPSISSHTLWHITTKFDVVTYVEGPVLVGRPKPRPTPRGSRRSLILGGFLLFMHTPFVAKLPNLTW